MSSRSLDKVRSPWTKVLLAELVKGDAVLADVKTKASRSVPPGRAIRMWQSLRHEDAIERTDSDKIRFGSRAIVNGTVHSMKQKGTIESYKTDGVKFLRLTDKGRKRYGDEEN
jgi:hypothetical protein